MTVNLCNAFIMVIIILVYENDIFPLCRFYSFVAGTALAYICIIFYYMQIGMFLFFFLKPLSCIVATAIIYTYYLVDTFVK